jgi:ABC-type transport system involved in multi-copper enzyme maturation permease subunit
MFDAASFSGLATHFSALTLLAAGPNDSWLTKWLTPVWFLGVGLAIGLVAICLFIVLARILSTIPVWERLSHSIAGHVVALAITAAIAGSGYYVLIHPAVDASELVGTEKLMLAIALSLLSAILGWAFVFCCSKQAAKNAFATMSEGVSGYLWLTTIVVVVVGLISTVVVEKPQNAFASLPELFETGLDTFTRKVPGSLEGVNAPFVAVETKMNPDLVESIEIKSDRIVVLADAPNSLEFQRAPRQMDADETISWSRTQKTGGSPIPFGEEQQLFVQNREVDEATIEFKVLTRPAVPEARTFLFAALGVFLVGLLILLQQAVAPRVSAVALATVKNELAQPLFLVMMLLGVLAILLFVFLPFNTFGEDIKLLKDCGITTIMLLAAFQGIWSASSSISEEIEGRTALTVLSKPIQRRSFVIGKFLGIFWMLFLMFVVLGTFELGAVAYKPIYDARENSTQDLIWQMCHLEMLTTIPGLAMAFMQTIVLSAISVALATRLPQLANLSVCFAIYVIGNLTTQLVSSTQEGFEIVRFVAQLVATIIPILEHFSMQAAIDAGNPITMSLLAGSLVYCLLYVGLAMFLALLLFEERDLT